MRLWPLLAVVFIPFTQAKNISFDELAKLSVEQNFGLKIRRGVKDQSEVDRWLAWRGLYLPQLELSFEVSDLNTDRGPLTSRGTRAYNPTTYGSTLSLEYNLFNGLKDYSFYQKQKVTEDQRSNEVLEKIEDLLFALKSKYFDLSQAINGLEIFEQEFDRTQSLLKAAKIRFQGGHIPRVDLHRSEVEHLQSQSDLIVQQKLITTTTQELLRLGEVANRDYQIHALAFDSLEQEIEEFIQTSKKRGFDKALNGLHTQYTERGTSLILDQLKQQIAGYERQQVFGGYLPKLSLEMAHTYGFSESLSHLGEQDSDQTAILLKLSIPVFSSLDTYFAHKKERINVINTEHAVYQDQLIQKQRLRELLTEMLEEHKSFKILKKKVELQNKVYRGTFKRFRFGGISTKDLIEDKVALLRENFNLADKSYNLRRLYLEIQKITGELKQGWE